MESGDAVVELSDADVPPRSPSELTSSPTMTCTSQSEDEGASMSDIDFDNFVAAHTGFKDQINDAFPIIHRTKTVWQMIQHMLLDAQVIRRRVKHLKYQVNKHKRYIKDFKQWRGRRKVYKEKLKKKREAERAARKAGSAARSASSAAVSNASTSADTRV